MLSPGDILAGKYSVERVLGKGGMGYVVAAVHTQLDQRVAVKFLSPDLCESREAVARFLREARAAVRIRSEHVARVIDVGTLDNGAPFMVMEFLEGHDLARELELRDRLTIAEAIEFVLQASEAVAEAHALGIVHRDLKPANLFLTRRADGSPLVKVLDFGISKAILPEGDTSDPAPSLTATQGLIGSPHYMSPEQVRKPKSVDGRTDIWALGIILHELMGGSPPFTSDTPMSVLAAVVSDPPPSLREIRPEVPEGLQAVILRCLEKDVSRRFQTVADVALALKPYAPSSCLASISRITGIVRASHPSRTTPSSEAISGDEVPTLLAAGSGREEPSNRTTTEWGHSQKFEQRSRRRLVVLGLGALSVLAVVGAALALRARAPEAEPDRSIASSQPSSPSPPALGTPSVAPAASAVPLPEPASSVAGSGGAPGASSAPLASAEPSRSTRPPAPAGLAQPALAAERRPKRPPQNKPSASASATSPGADPLDGRR